MFDVISIGDGTIDTYIKIHDAEVRCSLHKENCKICVEYGKKIPVDQLLHLVGGNACNNAVGSARLNLKTAVYMNLGSDAQGKQILDKLRSEGVNTRYVVLNKGMDSNYSAVLTFLGERTIFVYHQDWEYRLPDLEAARWVYFTSPSQSFIHSNLLNELIQYLERTHAKFVYNPGTFQIKMDIKKNPRLLSLTELFIVNKEEAEVILKKEKGISVKRLLKGIADLGPKMVVITDGKDGSYGFDGDGYFKLEAFPSRLMEMTGAGDAYATGCMAGLMHGKDLKEAMRWGACNGASVVEHMGAQEGLLTYNKMHERLNDYSKILTKEF